MGNDDDDVIRFFMVLPLNPEKNDKRAGCVP